MHPTNKPTIQPDSRQATYHAACFGKLSRDRITHYASRITLLILLTLCLTTLLTTHPAHAQSGRTYTTADGLPSNNIQALAYKEDPLNFPPCNPPECTDPPVIPGLWVGTDQGLTYLNGREDVTISTETRGADGNSLLPANDVRALLFDRNGVLWVATTGGLARIDYGDEPWEGRTLNWRSNHFLLGRELLALAQTGDGQLWVGTYAGLVKFDPTTGRDEMTAGSGSLRVTALPWCPFAIEGGCGHRDLWVGTDAGLYRLDWRGEKELVPVDDLPEVLAGGTVQVLTYDDVGLWVGTTKGAAHWDSEEWDTVFAERPRRLPHVNVRGIDVDDKGRVWFGTEEGVVYFTPEANTWRHFNRENDIIAGIHTQTLLLDADGAAWIGENSGLQGLDNRWTLLDQLSTYDYSGLAEKNIQVISHDHQGRTWVGTNGGGVTIFDNKGSVIDTLSTDNLLLSNYVKVISHDNLGRTWIGTESGGVTVVNEKLSLIDDVILSTNLPLFSIGVQVISHDAQGRTWIGVYGGGISIFDKRLFRIDTLNTDNIRFSTYRQVISHDAQGRTWVGTNGGITIFDVELSLIDTVNINSTLPSDSVQVISHDAQGRTWVGTNGGITIFDDKLSLIDTSIISGVLPSDSVQVISHDAQGRTWVGTNGGITIFDVELSLIAPVNINSTLSSNSVRGISHDARGRTWVDTYGGGVTILDDELSRIDTLSTDNELRSNNVQVISHDAKGHTWVGTDDGITIFDNELSLIDTLSTNNTFISNNIQIISHDARGRTWVGTSSGGVTILDDELSLIDTLSTDNELRSNNVQVISHDAKGRTWVGTSSGGVTILDDELSRIDTLSTDNELRSNNVQVISHDAQGRTWVGTASGVTIFDDELSRIDIKSPLVFISAHYISHDNQGHTWIGTNSGIRIFDNFLSNVNISAHLADRLSYPIRFLSYDRYDHMWIGTYDPRINLDMVTVLDKSLNPILTFNNNSELKAIFHDTQGRTWITMNDRVIAFDQSLARLNIEMQPFSGSIQAISSDSQDYIWVGSSGRSETNISVFDSNLSTIETFNIGTNSTSNFTQYISHDDKGRMWIGTYRSLTILEPSDSHIWIRVTPISSGPSNPYQLVDIQSLRLSFGGGSLLYSALDLGYQFVLTDQKDHQNSFSTIFMPGDVGAVSLGVLSLGMSQPLAYSPYLLFSNVFRRNLQWHDLPPLPLTIEASPKLSLLAIGDVHLAGSGQPISPVQSPLYLPIESSPLTITFKTSKAFISTSLVTNTTFSSSQLLNIFWEVWDEDATASETPLLQYRWDYSGSDLDSGWRTIATTANQAAIPPVPMARGAGQATRRLELRAVDEDGNASDIVAQTLTFAAPPSYFQMVLPFGVGLGTLFLVMLGGLVTLSRTSGLPLGVISRQGVMNWFPVGSRYRDYQQQWQTLTPLEQLVLLLIPPTAAISTESLQGTLIRQQTPVPPERIIRSLETLERQQWLKRATTAGYSAANPVLLRALQMHQGSIRHSQLATQVRNEHPLVTAANQFFPAAGFTVTPLKDPLAFNYSPTSPVWEQWFTKPVYARLIPDRPLDQEAVNELYRAAQQITDRADVIFALIDQTPTDSGWIAIGALRADGIQVIPIDDAFMQQARSQQRERQELQAHLRRFLGRQRDLYNVRDPVADRLNFFGREATAQDLIEPLNEGRPLALFGLRKMGKSSLLQVLGDRAAFPVAQVDLQAGVELGGLYQRILAGWQRTLPLKHPSITWTPPTLTSDPAAAFTAAVNGLLAQLAQAGVNPRLGIFVDEIDLLMPASNVTVTSESDSHVETVDRYLTFTRTLRGLVQETGQISLLVAGVDARLNHRNRWGDQQNPFYQFFQEGYLGPLVEEDCIQMVRNIGRQMGLVYGEGAAEAVAVVSGGHPFLARQLCSVALRLRGENAGSEIILDEIEAAADQFVRDPGTAANLDEGGMWGEVTNPALWPQPQVIENEAILTTLAETETQPEAELLGAAQDRQARERSVTELKQRAVLGQLEQLLRIQFGLFQTWIRRYRL